MQLLVLHFPPIEKHQIGVNWKDAAYKEKELKRGAALCSSFNVEISSAADKPAALRSFTLLFQCSSSSNSHLQRTRAAFDFWLLEIHTEARIFRSFAKTQSCLQFEVLLDSSSSLHLKLFSTTPTFHTLCCNEQHQSVQWSQHDALASLLLTVLCVFSIFDHCTSLHTSAPASNCDDHRRPKLLHVWPPTSLLYCGGTSVHSLHSTTSSIILTPFK